MGFGCNAAGVIATRVIDCPRERLIAILTNNFVPCNGRFPTLIMLATVFVAAAFPPALASVAAAGSVVMVVLIGVLFTLIVSALLSRTVLKGEASAFTLELPPYRRPSISRILYTSLIDRTIFVLWRAIQTAAPAGAVIWILANIMVGGQSLALHIANGLQPLGYLDRPRRRHSAGLHHRHPGQRNCRADDADDLHGHRHDDRPGGVWRICADCWSAQHGWTMLTVVNLMLFSLLHNPCATTILTIWKETRSAKWTTVGALMPLGLAFLVTFITATGARLLGWA